MEELFKSIVAALSNQFVSGGLLLMFTGSIMALARNVPGQVFAWAKRRVTIVAEIQNSDPLFDLITIWLDKQPYSKRSRALVATVDFQALKNGDGQPARASDEAPVRPRIFLSPGLGRHLFFYGGKLVYLYRNRETATMGGDKGIFRKIERYEITVFGRSQGGIRKLLEDVVDVSSQPKDSIKLYHSSFGYWECGREIKPRAMDTVVLPVGVAESVLEDARKFLTSEDWYRQVGIPWHRGYLLHGIPGSGKTSLVTAIAGELRMPLYCMNISTTGMDDERLSNLMSNVAAGSIVLMEDVDCSFPDRKGKGDKKDKVTLGGLLNCLDGVQSKEGCMIFMTTNFKDKLDTALIRPGRVDVQVEFNLADEHQIIRLKDRLAPQVSPQEALSVCKGMTMAEVQQWMLKDKAMKADVS